jgi:hypothetical protein
MFCLRLIAFGVCNSSGGCTASLGVQTSINSYKLYPLSSADVYYGWNGSAQLSNGYFFSKGASARYMTGAITTTSSPTGYWLRSNGGDYTRDALRVDASTGEWNGTSVEGGIQYGFRPAGVLNLDQK